MSDDIEILAPAEQTEGTRAQVLRWLKQPGERVVQNEPLVELETDKVTVEVAAPATGVLREIVKHEQDEVAPGELLGRLEPNAAAARAPSPAAPAPAARGASLRPLDTPAAAVTTIAPGEAHSPLSPAVRRLLSEHGLDPATVRGSGPHGRITVEDVLRAATDGDSGPGPAATETPASAAEPLVSRSEPPSAPAGSSGIRRVPHTAVRKRIAEHMVQSLLHTAPHVTTVFEADLGTVLADRERQREAFAARGVPLTLSAYFVQAAVAAIRAVPEANSRWTDTALEIHEAVHMGIATAVEGVGLFVPVLRDAQARDLFATAQGLHDLVTRARSGRLTPADVRGGTFTISNHGVSGSLFAAPIIINQPQAAILGIGRLEQRAVVVGEGDEQQLAARPRCYVSLTLDHRVMDGHQANHFLQHFVRALQEWRSFSA
jgi:2-oxoglutarate dehydrogenase E2 component (dihydrolipoamide succinyltransferase)